MWWVAVACGTAAGPSPGLDQRLVKAWVKATGGESDRRIAAQARDGRAGRETPDGHPGRTTLDERE